jgi:prepilin-type N-terminal cleavage/methylation domain-containing protein
MRREQGFTIIEVLIAVVLLATVVSGLALAMGSGAKLETNRDVKVRLAAAGERIYENIRSDKDWVPGCRRSGPTAKPKGGNAGCSISSTVDTALLKDDILDGNGRYDFTAVASGIDNPGDGSGRADADGVVDDFFRITISISVPRRDAARLGNPAPQVYQSIVNGSASSKSGSLVVAFCSADNQIDERVQISGCGDSSGTAWTEMPGCTTDVAGKPGCKPWALAVLDTKSLSVPSRNLGLVPVDVSSYSLRKLDSPDKGTVVTAGAGSVKESTGVRRFADLPEGTWQVVTPSSYVGGRVNWPTHNIPSTLQATVERQQTAKALVMLQKRASSKPFVMNFWRLVRERTLTATKGQEIRARKITPECESPRQRLVNAYVITDVTCNDATGHMVLKKSPGHMSNALDDGGWATRYESWGSFQDFVKINYITQSHQLDPPWTGAADTGEFASTPTPEGRYTDRSMDGSGHATYSIPVRSVVVPEAPHKPSAGYLTIGKTAKFGGLPAGLNEPLTLRHASKINNVSTSFTPAGCEQRFMWVRTNGSYSTCTGAKMIGDDGECYTHLHASSIGVGSYTWHDGCGAVKWPPLSGMIPTPSGYLITRICHGRQSWVKNAEEWRYEDYDTNDIIHMLDDGTWPEENSPEWDAQIAEFTRTMNANGYFKKSGTVSVDDWTSVSPHWEFHKQYGDSTRIWNTGCEDLRTHPLDCPTLRRWDNCKTVYVLQIPPTPGWNAGSGFEDGSKFHEHGGGIDRMSI